jgi:hypothetical protein
MTNKLEELEKKVNSCLRDLWDISYYRHKNGIGYRYDYDYDNAYKAWIYACYVYNKELEKEINRIINLN